MTGTWKILEDFVDWARKKKPEMERRGLTVSLRGPFGEHEPDAACLDIDSDRYIGRICVWDSGLCDLEALSVETGQTAFWQHLELEGDVDFDQAFAALLRLYD